MHVDLHIYTGQLQSSIQKHVSVDCFLLLRCVCVVILKVSALLTVELSLASLLLLSSSVLAKFSIPDILASPGLV